MTIMRILLMFNSRLTDLDHSEKEVIASKIQDMTRGPCSVSKDFNGILQKIFNITVTVTVKRCRK